jgi:hypothetical protein
MWRKQAMKPLDVDGKLRLKLAVAAHAQQKRRVRKELFMTTSMT